MSIQLNEERANLLNSASAAEIDLMAINLITHLDVPRADVAKVAARNLFMAGVRIESLRADEIGQSVQHMVDVAIVAASESILGVSA